MSFLADLGDLPAQLAERMSDSNRQAGNGQYTGGYRHYHCPTAILSMIPGHSFP